MVLYTQEETQYMKLVRRAMELWDLYGEKFRNGVDDYYQLLQQKRELRIYPLQVLYGKVLKAFPKEPFLSIDGRAKAEEYLSELSDSEIQWLNDRIEYIVEHDYAYRCVMTKIFEYRYQIRHHDDRKIEFGVDPNYTTRAHKRRSTGVNTPRDE